MRTFVVSSLLLGLMSSFLVGTSAQAPHAPIGTWAVAMTGSDRGIAYLTFSDDLTFAGYGMSLKSFGPFTIAGTWDYDGEGKVVGGFTQSMPSGANGWSFVAKLRGDGEFRGAAAIVHGPHLTLRCQPTNSVPNVSESWIAEGRLGNRRFFESYTLTASTNMAGWFDLGGQVISLSGTSTVSGALIVNTDRRVNGYTISDYGSSVTITSSFSGRFNAPLATVTFVGRDDNNHLVVIHANKQP